MERRRYFVHRTRSAG